MPSPKETLSEAYMDEKSASSKGQSPGSASYVKNDGVVVEAPQDDLILPRALKSATTYEGTPEERKLVRKLDERIMPLACILYLFACKFLHFTSRVSWA